MKLGLRLRRQNTDGPFCAGSSNNLQSRLHLITAYQVYGSLLNMQLPGIRVSGRVKCHYSNSLPHGLSQHRFQRIKVRSDYCKAIHTLRHQLCNNLNFFFGRRFI